MPADSDDPATPAVEAVWTAIRLRADSEYHADLSKTLLKQANGKQDLRDEAYRQWNRDTGETPEQIEDKLKARLRDRGATEAELRRAGTSHDTIRNAINAKNL